MRRLRRLGITLALLTLTIAGSRGETGSDVPYCYPDTCQVQFQTYTIDHYYDPNCFLRITYGARVACDGRKQIQIVAISYPNAGSGGGGCSPLGVDIFIMRFAFMEIIRQNQMLFPPLDGAPNGECHTNWEISQATCWRPSPTFFGRYEPCNATCCYKVYKVCMENGKRVATPSTMPVSGWEDCDVSDPGEGCDERCETLEDIRVGSDPGTVFPKRSADFGRIGVGTTLTVVPDPARSRIAIQVGAAADYASVNVFDISGKPVATVERFIVGGAIDVDVSALPSGVYSFQLLQHRAVLGTGTFRVAH